MRGEAMQTVSRLMVAAGGLLLSGQAAQAQAGGTTNACASWPGSPITWQLQALTAGNGSCDCSPLNVMRPVTHIVACNWQSAEFSFCGMLAHWELQWWGGVDQVWQLGLWTRPNSGSVSYIGRAFWNKAGADWIAGGPNTLNFVSGGPQCTWPATVTLSTGVAPTGYEQLGEGGLLLRGEGLQLRDVGQLGEGGLLLRGEGLQLRDFSQLGGGGGLLLSGSAAQSWAPAPVVPGTSCALAPLIALNTTYGPFVKPNNTDHWFKLPLVAGNHAIRVVVTARTGTQNTGLRGYAGATCGTAGGGVVLNLAGPGSYCLTHNYTSSGQWVRLIAATTTSITYTLRVDPGTC